MSIAFASGTDRHIGNTVEIGLQYLCVAEDFVTERVQAIQSDFYVGSSDPVLKWGKRINLENSPLKNFTIIEGRDKIKYILKLISNGQKSVKCHNTV